MHLVSRCARAAGASSGPRAARAGSRARIVAHHEIAERIDDVMACARSAARGNARAAPAPAGRRSRRAPRVPGTRGARDSRSQQPPVTRNTRATRVMSLLSAEARLAHDAQRAAAVGIAGAVADVDQRPAAPSVAGAARRPRPRGSATAGSGRAGLISSAMIHVPRRPPAGGVVGVEGEHQRQQEERRQCPTVRRLRLRSERGLGGRSRSWGAPLHGSARAARRRRTPHRPEDERERAKHHHWIAYGR